MYKRQASEDYEYDDEQRLVKTTKGNGRTSTTEWMCCGPLRETDEDGITPSYGYNSAKQLEETIRSATETTPETITSYSYCLLYTSGPASASLHPGRQCPSGIPVLI